LFRFFQTLCFFVEIIYFVYKSFIFRVQMPYHFFSLTQLLNIISCLACQLLNLPVILLALHFKTRQNLLILLIKLIVWGLQTFLLILLLICNVSEFVCHFFELLKISSFKITHLCHMVRFKHFELLLYLLRLSLHLLGQTNNLTKFLIIAGDIKLKLLLFNLQHLT